ncbi:coatomer subunit gamma-1 [Heterocephalus glaber]|uniref:Coatomer subunit gamma-1 n=1 Tax=Heterocephalus glaber TaxID=10181 RepID=A0AAX6S4T0_HETGA|nr:coatomer subunit gamma-1 [Heterocephalus glaber]
MGDWELPPPCLPVGSTPGNKRPVQVTGAHAVFTWTLKGGPWSPWLCGSRNVVISFVLTESTTSRCWHLCLHYRLHSDQHPCATVFGQEDLTKAAFVKEAQHLIVFLEASPWFSLTAGGSSNPFQHLEKSAVLQEARVFNETPINPRKCAHILTKILYLINQGEHLGTTEATEAFFAMTKLFQSNDPTLRRMCYLTIKQMSCITEDVIIVTSSLTKDMTGKEDNYRGLAVRALCQITDVSPRPPVSCTHFWLSPAPWVRVCKSTQNSCYLPPCTPLYHAELGCGSEGTIALAPAVQFPICVPCVPTVLQLFCSSPKAALRYAAVRTLNKVAMKHPSAVTACNLDLENLVTDSNRSIATLAITTLLKTGSESSIDRLMKQISSFMSEISDEFKVVVVQAISALCQKHPHKHTVLMNFLFTMLREEGGFEYKRAIVDCIISIIEENSESKETGLSHLCEFIEDCEFTVLATRILHLLGQEGPKTNNPSKYIRFIYNRVVLEHEEVRAGASGCGQMGLPDPSPLKGVALQRDLHGACPRITS